MVKLEVRYCGVVLKAVVWGVSSVRCDGFEVSWCFWFCVGGLVGV